MPTYEYRCGSCGEEFEKFQRMSDDPVAACPACGKPAERRISAGAGLVFKGSGFYITDYRSDSYKSAAKSEGGGSEKSEGGGSAKGESGGTAKSEGGSSGKASESTGSKPKSDPKPPPKSE